MKTKDELKLLEAQLAEFTGEISELSGHLEAARTTETENLIEGKGTDAEKIINLQANLELRQRAKTEIERRLQEARQKFSREEKDRAGQRIKEIGEELAKINSGIIEILERLRTELELGEKLSSEGSRLRTEYEISVSFVEGFFPYRSGIAKQLLTGLGRLIRDFTGRK